MVGWCQTRAVYNVGMAFEKLIWTPNYLKIFVGSFVKQSSDFLLLPCGREGTFQFNAGTQIQIVKRKYLN